MDAADRKHVNSLWADTVKCLLDAGKSPIFLLQNPCIRASDFPFQKKQFSVSKKGKFRFNSVSLLPKLNLMKSQYIQKKYSIESKLSLDENIKTEKQWFH